MAVVASGGWIAATSRMRPWQRGHSSTSSATTRRMSSAQASCAAGGLAPRLASAPPESPPTEVMREDSRTRSRRRGGRAPPSRRSASKAPVEGHGAALGAGDTPVGSGPAAQGREDGAHEDPEDLLHQGRVVGEPVAKPSRQREDPLPDGDLGEDPVHQVRGRVGHAAAAAGGAEAAAFAREGDQAIEPARIAVYAHESVGEDAAVQEGPELALDEARDGALAFLRAGEERLELLLDRAVEDALLGAAARVAPLLAAAASRGVRMRAKRSARVHAGPVAAIAVPAAERDEEARAGLRREPRPLVFAMRRRTRVDGDERPGQGQQG